MQVAVAPFSLGFIIAILVVLAGLLMAFGVIPLDERSAGVLFVAVGLSRLC